MQADFREQQPGPHPISKRQLEKWINYEPESHTFAASLGTSVDMVLKFIETGMMPSYPKEQFDLPYHADLAKQGDHLYYVTYVFDRLEKHRPDVAQVMKKMMTIWEDETIHRQLSHQHARSMSQYYAFTQAARTAFEKSSGRHAEEIDIFYLAYLLQPKFFNATVDELANSNIWRGDLGEIERNVNRDAVDSLRASYNIPILNAMVKESLSQRGVIVYLNDEIYRYAHPGVETEDELVIVTKQPLSSKFIIGIEPLSEPEKLMLQSATKP